MDEQHHSDSVIPHGTVLADTLIKILNYNSISKLCSDCDDKDPLYLINSLLSLLNLNYQIPEEDLKNIPSDGPFIIVSNNPYKGIDSMLLYKIISEKRNDFRILGSQLLHRIEPLREVVIPVNTHSSAAGGESSFHGIREALNHLKAGHPVGMFPNGDASPIIESSRVMLDNIWRPAALKFIANAGVPVIPVYFHGTNSRMSRLLGRLTPSVIQKRLPSEMGHKENRTIKLRIGSPVTIAEQALFSDPSEFGRFLRAKVYSLGSALEQRKASSGKARRKILKAEPVAASVPVEILENEFLSIRSSYELFSTKNYSVVCAPADKIPSIFNEIGRLRELTFRKVGEGTNKSIDIDEYDFYFNHLFIWDTDTSRIVGAYRIGMGREIIETFGTKGFYIHSLFRLKKGFSPILSQSLELGRSFVTEEYQKKAIPLFMLWKGIMVFLLKNPEYRYLIGPVSISNDFSKFSKSLIVEFIRKYFTDESYAGFVSPRKEFVVKPDKVIDRNIFIDVSESDINKIEKIVTDIEPGYRLPVLLKKYLEINGRIIAFNIDPKFNYCLDGLLILDLFNTPREFLQGLSRQLNDDSIMARFSSPGQN
jgi:putative hemolysin